MELNSYLRLIINNKIRPLFIKTNCEICNNEEPLHLHHVKYFNEIINETLSELNLKYQETEKYSKMELNNIINIVLGKHVQIEYMTLCDECHKNAHKENWSSVTVNDKHKQYYENLKVIKEIQRDLHVKKIVIPFLKNNLGKRLKRNEINELIKIIDWNDNRGRPIKSISKINKYLYNIDLEKYKIESRSTSESKNGIKNYYRYWEIIKA